VPKTNLTEEERYWAKVDRRGDDECWEWVAYRNKLGYGCFGLNGSSMLAHRYGYELANGQFDPALCVLHRCDNPPCQNPAHFFLGTRVDNNADRHSKGRSAHGERMGMAVLTEEAVRGMHRLYEDGVEVPAIAKEFRGQVGDPQVGHRRSLVEPPWAGVGPPADSESREGRMRHAGGETRATIAADFGIKPKYVNEIASGRAWASVA